jgi:hypothetical protein
LVGLSPGSSKYSKIGLKKPVDAYGKRKKVAEKERKRW